MAERKSTSEYGVGVPQASGAPAPAAKRPTPPAVQPRPDAPRAVFVAHGMGQQVRFATMDDFARGICEAAERHDDKITSRLARAVRAGCTTVRRIEIGIEGKAPVHVYEGYWAPLTEGVVTLRDALRFLFSGGLNGIRSRGELHRWLFGHPREFPIPKRDRISLWLALIAIFSIVFVGATILTVGIARLALGRDDISLELLQHLTGIFETLATALVVSAVVAAAMLAAIRRSTAKKQRRARVERVEPRWAWILIIPAAFAGLAFFLAAVLIVLSVMRDVHPPFPQICAHGAVLWCFDLFHRWVVPLLDQLDRFFCWIEAAIRWVLTSATLLAAAVVLWRMLARRRDPHDARARAVGGRLTSLLLLVALAIFILVVGCRPEAIALITWVVLLALTAFVRRFLIEYAGDVAAYVCPHVLDRFFDLRERVKDTVWKAARAVYALRDDKNELVYDSILVAGHSLGSVVVYDVLNRLINEDELFGHGDAPKCCEGETPEPLDVAQRTKLLLTYGSPLDKTAFIFATQASTAGSERDALIASGQPLIVKERKLEWLNIWSPFDIIGGPLEFYDTPEGDTAPNENRVVNEVDPDANILLAAHTQYGDGPLLFDRLYEKL